MSRKPLWNLVGKPGNSGWDLAAEVLGLGRIWPVEEPDMFG
jgi:hypothetical protein